MQLQISPLYASATSWIVITPNAFKQQNKGIKVTLKSPNKGGRSCQVSRLEKFTVSSNLLGIDTDSVMYGHNYEQRKEVASLTKVMT